MGVESPPHPFMPGSVLEPIFTQWHLTACHISEQPLPRVFCQIISTCILRHSPWGDLGHQWIERKGLWVLGSGRASLHVPIFLFALGLSQCLH